MKKIPFFENEKRSLHLPPPLARPLFFRPYIGAWGGMVTKKEAQ